MKRLLQFGIAIERGGACLCAGEISAAGLYAKGAGYCLCRGRPAGRADDSGNGCEKQVRQICASGHGTCRNAGSWHVWQAAQLSDMILFHTRVCENGKKMEQPLENKWWTMFWGMALWSGQGVRGISKRKSNRKCRIGLENRRLCRKSWKRTSRRKRSCMSRKCSRKKKIDRAVDNVDFQLFLTQILYLNSKRVKIGGVQELSTSKPRRTWNWHLLLYQGHRNSLKKWDCCI